MDEDNELPYIRSTSIPERNGRKMKTPENLEYHPRLRPWYCPGAGEVVALIAGALVVVIATMLPIAASLVTWP